ncbi:transposase [Streptomyces broussonetiae]|uniref:Transposase n=1 Tax=Streptomyces broussonetiae TaxID=2686304 RepID=A0A6I6N7N9_9ACTN|nr:transposase [Streptomyces broussonetiae]
MGAAGTRADNAACESFHASLTRETLQGARRFGGPGACRRRVFRWLTHYNTRRRHSANEQLSPVAYEQRSATLTLAAQPYELVSTFRVGDPGDRFRVCRDGRLTAVSTRNNTLPPDVPIQAQLHLFTAHYAPER